MKIFSIIFLCTVFCTTIFGARILGILHLPVNSHNIIGVTLFNNLAEKGHQVTILSETEPKLNSSNIRFIRLKGIKEILEIFRKDLQSALERNAFYYYQTLLKLGNECTENTLKNNEMQKLMKSGEKFDLVFIEPFFNQAFVGFGSHFNAQVIVLSTSNSFIPNMIFGNLDVYSFIPDSITSYHTDKMNFKERFSNAITSIYFHICNEINKPIQGQLYNKYFPHAAVDYQVALRNVSLHFVNTHVIYESPRQYFPNMIPIGGLHLYKQPEKLSKDIKDFLDNAKHGAIFFSLGSYLQSKDISDVKKSEIIKTFSKLPQRILWKFEDDVPELPKNVLTSNWFPQNEILAHPNLKLFISHCGQLSTIEAIYNGVPTLGVPFMFDQFSNIAQFEAKGYGERIIFSELTEETFTAKIKQILENSSYSNNIKIASQIVRDQSETPLERAIFWTEHILKYGSKHLRPVSLDLSITEYLLLDVLACVFSILIFICFLIYIVIHLFLMNFSKRKHYKDE